MHPELKADFVRRVLDLSWAFLSDESSLNDFGPEKSNDFLVSKIREVYGVDVSDITSGNLAEIFERISKTKVT
jgi:muramidase (phage lysozyme)